MIARVIGQKATKATLIKGGLVARRTESGIGIEGEGLRDC